MLYNNNEEAMPLRRSGENTGCDRWKGEDRNYVNIALVYRVLKRTKIFN